MIASPPSPEQLDVRRAVDGHLDRWLADQRALLTELASASVEMLDAAARMLAGGKRVRAALCYWSARAHGAQQGSAAALAALRVGAALELFQAAALFHDDVIDDSNQRRGAATAHRHFADVHARRDWSGDPRRFGQAAAILLGDLCLIGAEAEFAAALPGLPGAAAGRAREIFDLMRTEVSVGQYLDIRAQAQPWGLDPAADLAAARTVIRRKSARYSVEHPMALGAAIAGADDAALDFCGEVGLPLGEAFQLRDDLLGVYGDPAVTGKPAGDDLREGKRTVLVAVALRRALAAGDDGTAELLRSKLGAADLGADDVAGLAEAVAATGAPDEVELLIEELAAPALAALGGSALAEPGRRQLTELARSAVRRQA